MKKYLGLFYKNPWVLVITNVNGNVYRPILVRYIKNCADRVSERLLGGKATISFSTMAQLVEVVRGKKRRFAAKR